ncbi:uncharacterized protein [Chlorocebus sabaeus]|uniref:uncharacterized protein n=1 Tax=Chlorocebus sabaeus TaxID=60711 RepID=UPI0018B0AA36|nr:uncharacterized protein LOC119618770 [Chlorocebus sabaeus]
MEFVVTTRVPTEPHATKEDSCCTPRGTCGDAGHCCTAGSAPPSRFQSWLAPTPINEEEDSLCIKRGIRRGIRMPNYKALIHRNKEITLTVSQSLIGMSVEGEKSLHLAIMAIGQYPAPNPAEKRSGGKRLQEVVHCLYIRNLFNVFVRATVSYKMVQLPPASLTRRFHWLCIKILRLWDPQTSLQPHSPPTSLRPVVPSGPVSEAPGGFSRTNIVKRLFAREDDVVRTWSQTLSKQQKNRRKPKEHDPDGDGGSARGQHCPLPPTPELKWEQTRSGHKSRLLLSFAKAEKSPRGPWRASRGKRAVTIPTGRPPRSFSADKAASKALRGPRVTTFRSAEESESGCSLTGSQTIAVGRPLHASIFVSLAPGNCLQIPQKPETALPARSFTAGRSAAATSVAGKRPAEPRATLCPLERAEEAGEKRLRAVAALPTSLLRRARRPGWEGSSAGPARKETRSVIRHSAPL